MWSLREVKSLDLPKVIRGGVWIQSQIHPTPDLHPSSPCYAITASVGPSLENGGIDLEWPLMLQLHLSKKEKCCHLQCSKFDFCMKSQELFYQIQFSDDNWPHTDAECVHTETRCLLAWWGTKRNIPRATLSPILPTLFSPPKTVNLNNNY